MDKYAVIDLGTNTFHILIASLTKKGKVIEHFRDRRYIHLAESGIEEIGIEAYKRALHCLVDYKAYLDQFDIKAVNCSGTAALRTASNGSQLIQEIYRKTKIEVNLIDGIAEAKYIYEGVKLAISDINYGNHIIMDIGGGSVEFIVIKDGHLFWSNSFPVGVAVLKRKYHHSEPINQSEILKLRSFLEDQLTDFLSICEEMKFESLIGASGSFEVLNGMHDLEPSNQLSNKISIAFFEKMYQELISLDLEERLLRTDIPNDRAKLIVVAFILMNFVITRISFQGLIVSAYAMKEGILEELSRKTSDKN